MDSVTKSSASRQLSETERQTENAAWNAVHDRTNFFSDVVEEARDDFQRLCHKSVVSRKDKRKIEMMLAQHEQLTIYLTENYRLFAKTGEVFRQYLDVFEMHSRLTQEIIRIVGDLVDQEHNEYIMSWSE